MRSSKTNKVKNRARQIFRLAAKSAGRSKTALGAFYRRLKARIGAPKAFVATARKRARIFYHMVTQREPYREAWEAAYTQQQKNRYIQRLKRQAKQ
ncbi:MAG: hypothetical protein GY801_01695 [bacterium]|nr:hypothetical protein [bacterium]